MRMTMKVNTMVCVSKTINVMLLVVVADKITVVNVRAEMIPFLCYDINSLFGSPSVTCADWKLPILHITNLHIGLISIIAAI